MNIQQEWSMRRRSNQNDLNRIIKTNLKYQTKEFFNNSTLHGVRYIAEEGRSFSEKFMWFCFVAIGAVSAFVIIASLWEKFQTNPTITGTNFLHILSHLFGINKILWKLLYADRFRHRFSSSYTWISKCNFMPRIPIQFYNCEWHRKGSTWRAFRQLWEQYIFAGNAVETFVW